jgi:TnpA family transposase
MHVAQKPKRVARSFQTRPALGDLKEKKMALESFKAQISLLLEQMINQPEDQHEVQEQLREKLREMRAMGLPLPADLVALEKRLDDDFYAAGN